MKYSYFTIFVLSVFLFLSTACRKKEIPVLVTPIDTSKPRLVFKFVFDSTQQRLNNIGQPSLIPAGNAAQSPKFNLMCAHYIELAPTGNTLLGNGKVLYHAPEVNTGGSTAIDFSKSVLKGNGETFFSIPINQITPGSYEWIRVSLAYQNYDVKFRANGINAIGTIASFIGYNTYIQSFKIKNETLTINANKLQGFWAFETNILGTNYVNSGQAPPGATTVPNPLFSSSPVPQGSCVVTGKFTDGINSKPLIITENETNDILVTISLSTNKSFEWSDNGNGIFEPLDGDVVVDMGIRGMIAKWQ